MLIIQHRVNNIKKLKSTPQKFGVEVDLRSYKKKIILNHEILQDGIEFNSWCKKFNNKFLILNIKEEGLEENIIKILKKNKIKCFFFLDQSFPFLIKKQNVIRKKTALRYSNLESVQTCLLNKNVANWIWIDLIGSYKINQNHIKNLKKNFKLCLASPELTNKVSKKNLDLFIKNNIHLKFDAVCTKFPDRWSNFL